MGVVIFFDFAPVLDEGGSIVHKISNTTWFCLNHLGLYFPAACGVKGWCDRQDRLSQYIHKSHNVSVPMYSDKKWIVDMLQNITPDDLEKFIEDGYLCIENAFPRSIAYEVRKILWTQTGCSPTDRSTWTKPIIRLGMFSDGPFLQACNSPVLHQAFDTLVGTNRWQLVGSMGTFPIRFPSDVEPGDDGWHIDMSFGTENPDFMSWRVNFKSKGRALLLLFLFSDVGENDAPTRIRVGSHLDIARILKPAGEAGMTLGELVPQFNKTAHCEEAYAVGAAGTVYLCHPFLVHAAQKHRGNEPKFMAQPPLLPSRPFDIENDNISHGPVEQAIRRAIGLTQKETTMQPNLLRKE